MSTIHHKEKQEAWRRKELTKQKIIEESEDVLLNNANIPMSEDTLRIVQRRIFDALNAMVQLSSISKELKTV